VLLAKRSLFLVTVSGERKEKKEGGKKKKGAEKQRDALERLATMAERCCLQRGP